MLKRNKKPLLGSIKKAPKKVTIGTAVERKTKKGNSTPKARAKSPTVRFFEIKVLMSTEDYDRGKPYFQEQKYLYRFMLDAYREKVNRSESYDKAGRLRALANNMDLLAPILKEMHAQGKLNFLNEKTGSNL